METPVPDAGATGTVTLCPEQPCWAGGAVPRRQLRAAGPSSARCPRPERGAAPAVPGPGEGARRPRAKAVAGGSGRGPGPGSDRDPDPSPGPARPARPGSVPGSGTAVVYPRPEPPGAALGGFPLRGAEARFNAAK